MNEFSSLFPQGVPKWLLCFSENPREAIAGLLDGTFSEYQTLNPVEPERILLDWIRGIGDAQNFRQRVDDALSKWIFLTPNPQGEAWTRVFVIVAQSVSENPEGLIKSAEALMSKDLGVVSKVEIWFPKIRERYGL